MSIPEHFFIERQGKRMVLYAGLLDLAHQRGLKSIDTELIQKPTEQNSNTAICKAVVEMEGGRKFSGIGDANPTNVGRNIIPHLTRMSETRSKARALRDATNIAVTAFEEMGDDAPEDAPRAPTRPREAQRTQQSTATQERAPQGQDVENLPATRKQLNYLEALIPDAVEEGMPKFEEMAGKPVSELTRAEASDWISHLSGRSA